MLERERFSPSICTRAEMEKPASPHRFRFVELHVRGLVCLGWRELRKQWQNVREFHKESNEHLSFSNCSFDSLQSRNPSYKGRDLKIFIVRQQMFPMPLPIPFPGEIQANPCLSWTPTTNQSWIDVRVHDIKRFPFTKMRNSNLYLNIVAREMRPESLGSWGRKPGLCLEQKCVKNDIFLGHYMRLCNVVFITRKQSLLICAAV